MLTDIRGMDPRPRNLRLVSPTGPSSAYPVERKTTARKLVLVDFENMLSGHHERDGAVEKGPDPEQLLTLAQARRPNDQVIVGCNPKLVFAIRELFPGARIVTGYGADGADLALVESVDFESASGRFEELCIVSGDHIFAPVAVDARRAGLRVRVVGPKFGLSTMLRARADTAVLLPEWHEQEVEAA